MAVDNVCKSCQKQLIEERKTVEKKLILGGDGRCDSRGHTAKYGSYSLMDMVDSKILDFLLVQSNEVTSSNVMELVGFKRSLDFLVNSSKLNVDQITTDRHQQLKKYLRQNHPTIQQWFDGWHLAKGSAAHKVLKSIVLAKGLLIDIGKISPAAQTSSIESYHRLVVHFAPKDQHYFFDSMNARLQLSALHFNENSNREQAVTTNGSEQFQLYFSKLKDGAPVAKQVKVPMTFNYVSQCYSEVWHVRKQYTISEASDVWTKITPKMEHLADQYDRSDITKEEVILTHISRLQSPVKSPSENGKKRNATIVESPYTPKRPCPKE
ncbi:uncharacterized protein LOC141909158 [Tubulanus polymorphus]|uniref:uncharacterized protein LOC141909158 n=1 Tax=Tubulanus polymorphus TaxID=672921 RepID=UPI003DA3FF83